MEHPHYGFWLPPNISTHGAEIDNLISVLHWFMLVLFVGWALYLVYCLIRFRERPGHEADISGSTHFSLPKYIEIGIIIFEAVLLVFFSFPLWSKVKRDFPNEADALVVRVTAEQFAWTVHYAGKDGKFGQLKIELIDGTNPVGLDREDPNGKDDILSPNTLNIPINKPIIAKLTSKDVIHNFFLPVMRVKQDIIPGMTVPVWFQATQTGKFEIGCAQLCGVGHTQMRGFFNVMSQEEFETWYQDEEKSLLASSAEPLPRKPLEVAKIQTIKESK